MTIVATFDPTTLIKSTFNTRLPIGGIFLLTNQSNVNLTLTFADGKTAYAPAWQITPFKIPTTNPNVIWSQQSILAGNTAPISQVTIDAYGSNETVLGTYPVAVQHTAYIPNQVSTSMGGSTSVQNDGNAQVVFIEATASGSPSSNVSIDNAGNMFIAQTVGGVVTKLLQVIANVANTVLIGMLGKTVEVLGALLVDQNLTVKGSSSLDNGKVITDGSGNETASSYTTSGTAGYVYTPGASSSIGGGGLLYSTIGGTNTGLYISGKSSLDNGNVTTDGNGNITQGTSITAQTQTINGVIVGGAANRFQVGFSAHGDAIDIDSSHNIFLKNNSGTTGMQQTTTGLCQFNNGITLLGGTLSLQMGTISKIAYGASTTVLGVKTIAHGIGGFPFWADAVINSNVGSTTFSVTWDATNVYVYSPNAGFNFTWIAFLL